MAKVNARPTTVSVDTVTGTLTDISNDTVSVTIGTPYESQDITGVDRSALERQLLMADCEISLSGIFNPTLSHAVLCTTTVSSVARTTTIALPGSVSLSVELIYSEYTVSRDESGALTWTATGSLASGTVPAWA